MVYQWKPASQLTHIDAQAAGEAIAALEASGAVTPERVLLAARPKSSPLHEAFEWDNAKAADAYRLTQARFVLRSLTVVREDVADARPVRAFVTVTTNDEDAQPQTVYTNIAKALADPVLRAQILMRARTELEQWRTRYKDLEEFAAVFTVVDTVVQQHSSAA